MDKLITLLVVLAVMALLAFLAKNEKPETGEAANIYRYSSGVLWITAFVAAFFSLFTPWLYFSGELEEVRDIVGLSLFAFFGFLIWFFFYKSKIYVTEKSIIKKTPFWATEIPYNEVNKIVIYRSQANPGAAMTRVYGKKKITLEAILISYEDLVNELRYRCDRAKVIEK